MAGTMRSPATVGAVTEGADHPGSYIDWSAVIAGAVVATAIAFVLVTFGAGIGLSMGSLEPGEGVSLRWMSIAAGLWFIWVAVSSFAAGGYLTGRMRRPHLNASADEVETRDGANGIVVWATGALFGAVLATSGITGLVGAGASAVGGASQTVADAVGGDVDYFAGTMLRGENAGSTGNPEQLKSEFATILTRGLKNGEIPQSDRDYLARTVAAQTGLDADAAQARVDDAIAQAQSAWDSAKNAAESARVAGVIATFVIAATLLMSAAAAYFAATFGGQHRDELVPFRTFRR